MQGRVTARHGVCRLSNQITLSYPQRSTFSQSLSVLNPSQQIAKLKDAGRRVREHLQRPTLERSMTTDPLFHDEETDDIMRPSIIPGPIQAAPPLQAPPLQLHCLQPPASRKLYRQLAHHPMLHSVMHPLCCQATMMNHCQARMGKPCLPSVR